MSGAGPSQGALAPLGLSPAAPDLPAQIGTGQRVAACGGAPSSAVRASSVATDAGAVTSVGAK